MKVADASKLINEVNLQFFGIDSNAENDPNKQFLVSEEDTSGIIATGKKIESWLNNGQDANVDNYVRALLTRLSRIVFATRVVTQTLLGLNTTTEEWGEVVEKVRFAVGDVQQDDKWSLVSGQEYPQDTYYPPTVMVQLFDGIDAFCYPISKTKDQIKNAFTGVGELNSFMTALEVSIGNAMITYLSGLEQATLVTFMASILAKDEAPQRKVQLLSEYKKEHPAVTNITPEEALASRDFLEWMCARIDQDVRDMAVPDTYYNGTDVYPTFTTTDNLRCVLLSPVATRVQTIAKASTFNSDFVKLPYYKTLPRWQGAKDENGISLEAKSSIDVTNNQIINTSTSETPNYNYKGSYIIGCLFDKDAMGVNMYGRDVDISPYNARGCFWTEWHRAKGRYYIDPTENAVIYVLA